VSDIDWTNVTFKAPPPPMPSLLAMTMERVIEAIRVDERMPAHLICMGGRWFRASDGAEVERPGWWEST
jgi:hypothetical protein